VTSNPFLRRFSSLIAPCLLLALAASAAAQLKVELKIPRRMYLAYEPVIATVAVTNLAGRDMTLQDEGINTWFGFQITDGEERLISPLNPNYHLDPLTVPAGQTLKRSVNLGAIFPIAEYGVYHVKANIYSADLKRYFVSSLEIIEVSEGKTIWRQSVGVPEGNTEAGAAHIISLLTFRRPKTTYLYVRVEDQEQGKMFGTYAIGPMIAALPPTIELDRDNSVHVLQVVGPKTYSYTRIGVNGEFLGNKTYIEVQTRPHLARSKAGSIEVKGGQVQIPPQPAGATPGPKLSDRPADMPID
jgi:hypothetical protein